MDITGHGVGVWCMVYDIHPGMYTCIHTRLWMVIGDVLYVMCSCRQAKRDSRVGVSREGGRRPRGPCAPRRPRAAAPGRPRTASTRRPQHWSYAATKRYFRYIYYIHMKKNHPHTLYIVIIFFYYLKSRWIGTNGDTRRARWYKTRERRSPCARSFPCLRARNLPRIVSPSVLNVSTNKWRI